MAPNYIQDLCVAMEEGRYGLWRLCADDDDDDLCVPVTTVYTHAAVHSSARGDLVVPRSRQHLGNWAFCVAGPVAWNSFPPDICTASTLSTFKNQLKSHLFFIFVFCSSVINLIRVAYIVRHPCGDFTDMLWRLTNCCIIIIIIIIVWRGGKELGETLIHTYYYSPA